MRFPDWYPESCPPDDALPARGKVYRLVCAEGPQADDFVPLWQCRPNHKYPDMCKACGLSVHRSREDAERLRSVYPTMRDKTIACGTLTPEMGVTKHTPSRISDSHTSWWVPCGTNPQMLFGLDENCSEE